MSYGVYIVHSRHSPISMRLYVLDVVHPYVIAKEQCHMKNTHNTHVCCDDGICCKFLICKLDELLHCMKHHLHYLIPY